MDAVSPVAPAAAALASSLRATFGRLRRKVREQGGVGDLTPSQVSALLRLEADGAATTSGLARAEGVRPQSMAAVVAALEAAGLVRGSPDPSDGRKVVLSLTETCRRWLREGRAARQDWLSRTIAARLSPDEQETVATAMVLLGRLLDD